MQTGQSYNRILQIKLSTLKTRHSLAGKDYDHGDLGCDTMQFNEQVPSLVLISKDSVASFFRVEVAFYLMTVDKC